MQKNQRPNQDNDLWYIPAVATGKPDFGAPICPVRALRYYHRYVTEHPELRKGRHHLFITFKDNNAGKELRAVSISLWSCTTLVDSHASLQNSKSIPENNKAHEVYICCGYSITNLQRNRPTSCHEDLETLIYMKCRQPPF